MTDWITVNELARIQGVTPRAIRKGVANDKYVVRKVSGARGLRYEIFVPALNETTQNLIDFEKSKYEIEKNREPILRKTPITPPHAQQIALARYDLVNLWVDYKKISKNKTQAGKEFIDIYNDGKVYSLLFNILGKISIGTIYRWHKAIKGNDDYKKLIPNYDYGEKEPNPKLTHEEELVFKSLLLTPNKTNIGKATKLTKYILKKKGLESPTCERNFRRYAEHFKRNHYDEWILAREGQEELSLILEQLISENVIKEDSQGYLFIKGLDDWRPRGSIRTKPFVEGSEYDKFKQQKPKDKTKKSEKDKNYGLFVPHNELNDKLSFYEIINSFLEKYAAKFCTPSTIQTYQSLLKNHILPYFKNQKPEEVDDLVIKDFYRYCKEKDLSPRRFKNTMALLKQVLNYAKNNGFTSNSFNFQVKRLTPRNEFSLSRIVFN